MNRAKIIVETSPYWHYTIDYMMSSIEAAGFSAIELWTAAPHYCFADAPEAMKGRRAEICDCAKAHGLTIPVFSPEQMVKYPWNIASPDPYMEKKSMEIVSSYIKDAAEFGADTIRIGTGWQHLDCSSEQNRQRSIANFRELAQQAAEAGLTVIAGTSGRQIGSFARDLPSLKAYLEEAGMENVKAAVTLPELREAGMSYVSCRDYFEGKLGHLYLADTGGTVPGSGSADVEAFVAECDKEGYEGRLSLQISFRDCILTPDRWIFESAAWINEMKKF